MSRPWETVGMKKPRMGPPGRVFGPLEPARAELLATAGLVQRDQEVRLLGLEVGRGIVESGVAVLADPHEGRVDRVGADQLPPPARLGRGVGRVGLDEMEAA